MWVRVSVSVSEGGCQRVWVRVSESGRVSVSASVSESECGSE